MDICKPCYSKCNYENCNALPKFNNLNEKQGLFCLKHKQEGMINVINKKCNFNNCNIHSNYNIPGEKKGLFCIKHKHEGMINVTSKKCNFNNCINQPSYNIPGEKRGLFCVNHKHEHMVDVKNRKCQYTGCFTIPIYNISNEEKGIFCIKHKHEGMVNVKHRKCQYTGCFTIPVYNKEGEKQGLFCVNHKHEGMIDVINKKCNFNNCNISPVYNIPGEKRGLFCVNHKHERMVNIVDKKCEYKNCNTRATFNISGLKATRCSKHKEKGMMYNPKSRCKICKKFAIYGINSVPTHCEEHKEENQKNLVERECINCGLLFILDIYNKCEYCNPESFKIVRLAKQNALMEYLDYINLKGDSTDIIIDNGICGKERPDRVYDFNDKIIILECDEYQHRERPYDCEQKRMINISQSFGGTPVYFIRWNPDNYVSKNHKNNENIKNRYKTLGKYIDKIKNNKINLPNTLLSVFYMYYNEWDDINNEKWKVIL